MKNVTRVRLPLAQPPHILDMRYGPVPLPDIRHYCNPHVWNMHLYRYSALLLVNGEEFTLAPGLVTIIPPAARLEYRWHLPDNLHLYAHLTFASSALAESANLPLLLDAGPAFARLWHGMESGIAAFPTHPAKARSRVWEVLWELAELGRPPEDDPVVAETQTRIASAIGDAPRVGDLARAAGVSQDTLDRRFQARHGLTVKGYLQQIQRDRITYLLRQGLAPADVAREMGIINLQAFNKLVRRLHGKAPRSLADGMPLTGQVNRHVLQNDKGKLSRK